MLIIRCLISDSLHFCKKYWIELTLIFCYLIADNLHMYIDYINYTPKWYVSPELTGQIYHFSDSVFYLLHYSASAPLLMTFILLISSPRELNKIWLRLSLFFASLKDVIGEVCEIFNLNLTCFSNQGYNYTCIFKILFLISAVLIAFKLKKTCMKLLNYLSLE